MTNPHTPIDKQLDEIVRQLIKRNQEYAEKHLAHQNPTWPIDEAIADLKKLINEARLDEVGIILSKWAEVGDTSFSKWMDDRINTLKEGKD